MSTLVKIIRWQYWFCFSHNEAFDPEAVLAERYQGIRPAPGYPACPEHSEKQTLFRLLDATHHTGITLTENYAMSPAAAVSGWYFSHPDSRYFGVGKIDRDQLEAYARRKQLSLDEAQQLLRPALAD